MSRVSRVSRVDDTSGLVLSEGKKTGSMISSRIKEHIDNRK